MLNKTATLRLSEEQRRKLADLQAQTGLSRSALLRRMLDLALAQPPLVLETAEGRERRHGE